MKISQIVKKIIYQKNIKKIFFLILYRLIFRHFPKSTHLFFGTLSKWCRYQCCRHIFKECGKNVNIEKGADFGSGFDLIIGDYSGIGINCKVPSNIIIGKYVMMGPNCYILDKNHKFDSIEEPMMLQGFSPKVETIIEDDVWLGREVLLTPGKIIRKGTIVGARTVLTKNYPAYSIIGGNPSKLIRLRNEN